MTDEPDVHEQYRAQVRGLLNQAEHALLALERRALTDEEYDRLVILLQRAQMRTLNSYRDLHGPVDLDISGLPRSKRRSKAQKPT